MPCTLLRAFHLIFTISVGERTGEVKYFVPKSPNYCLPPHCCLLIPVPSVWFGVEGEKKTTYILLLPMQDCTGLRLLDFSFGQCAYVSLETNITNHLCQRIQVSGELCSWASWMQACLVKGWRVTDHMTKTQSSSMFNTLGGSGEAWGRTQRQRQS